jgi:Ca2+-transporting ATPase
VRFSQTQEAVLQELEVNSQAGLSSDEVSSRLNKYGPNKLKSKPKKSLITLFFSQLRDMLIYVLLGAAVVTLIIGEFVDSIIILIVVVLNAAIGVFQEHKAEKAIEALQQLTTPHCLVRRDGETKEIESEDLVPGDIVILDAGRYIPADLRLIASANLQIEESALTGESVPSDKEASDIHDNSATPIGDQSNMAFMSTLVTYGRGEGVVTATGMDTEMGKIAKILDEDLNELTPLQQKLEQLGKMLGYTAIGICALIFVIAIIQGRDLFEMFLTAISLAVAAIPEGLAAIVAIVLALGVTRMSKINAIVKKLPAVETLGSVTIICSDKTGTLTQNKMTVVKHHTFDSNTEAPPAVLIESFVLCSDATYDNSTGAGTGDPTEIALVVFGDKHQLGKRTLDTEHPRLAEKPFDSDRKLMSTQTKWDEGYRIHTKGAIDQLLKISTKVLIDGQAQPLTETKKQELLNVAESMSDEALRVLAVAYRDTDRILSPDEMEQELTFIGFVGMIDPPRNEVKPAIAEAKIAGITPVMITGDHRNTAVAIARELGIADSIEQSMLGAEIDELSEQTFAEKIKNIRVFARVSPEHKVKIVKAYKAQGHIVSMTGDGVNDAPSLKNADIGVAMGITGTDVSKGASDMILTDDNFTTIVSAVKEGRTIYANIRKSVIFLLSCNLGEVVAILASILFFWPVPLLPTQILWINLVTDTLPAIALGIDPGEKDVMKQKPRDPQEGFFAHGAGLRVAMGGLLIGILTLIAFYIGLREHGYSLTSKSIPEDVMTYARTMSFVVLAATQLFYSLTMRSNIKSIFQVGLFTNKFLLGAIVAGLVLQFAVITIPFLAGAFKVHNLSLLDWGVVIILGLIPVAANEIVKVFMRMRATQ